VLQLRGGSDLTLSRHDPGRRPAIAAALRACDQLLTDNRQNFEWALELGAQERQFADIAPVPGTGGLDLEAVAAAGSPPPSRRRLVLVPKAYESTWSKVMPVLEALRDSWNRLGDPPEVHLLAATDEIRRWVNALPEVIRSRITIEGRVPRSRSLDLMGQARAMVAPSLIDGTPNTLFEAMAWGALPIVSPLPTITPIVESPDNVLFARNLHPDEIADALVRAMTDDDLVDLAAARNRDDVRRLADRSAIRPRVVAFYEAQLEASRCSDDRRCLR
jgi:glycosyltransferase involved in cell wall biosynthesis